MILLCDNYKGAAGLYATTGDAERPFPNQRLKKAIWCIIFFVRKSSIRLTASNLGGNARAQGWRCREPSSFRVKGEVVDVALLDPWLCTQCYFRPSFAARGRFSGPAKVRGRRLSTPHAGRACRFKAPRYLRGRSQVYCRSPENGRLVR
jgi:hypothetical protein